MKIISVINNGIAFIERSIVVLMLSCIVILSFLQVILRNIFDTGLLWVDPLLRHLVIWIGFLGASLATQTDRHIGIDLITRFVPQKYKSSITLLTLLFALAVCLLLVNAGWTFLKNEIESDDILFIIGSTTFKTWWFQVIIPFGFALITLRLFFQIINLILQLTRKT